MNALANEKLLTGLTFIFHKCSYWKEPYFIQKGILVKMGAKKWESQVVA